VSYLHQGRLVRYLHPSDEDLRKAAGIPAPGSSKGKGRRSDAKKGGVNKDSEESFSVPRNTPLQLDAAKVDIIDLLPLHYYGDYLWIVDFAISAVVVYVLTEIYYVISNVNELNISILWCLLAIGFCVRVLLSMTGAYFKAEDGGERILIVTFGFFCLVLSMGVLVIDEKYLEFGLEDGYKNFSSGATALLKAQGVESTGPVHFLTFKIFLAFFCSLIGALLTFPGLRVAKLYIDSLKYSKEHPFRQIMLHFNFALPYIVLLLWIKPIGRDMLCGLNWKVTSRLMTEDVFENFRIFMFVLMCITRVGLLSTHVQSHLNLAYVKVLNLQKESGRITNVELRKLITSVFYFVIVVAVQYLTPVIILLFMAFMYKTLGEFSWSGTFGDTTEQFVMSFRRAAANSTSSASPSASIQNATETIVDKVSEYSLAFGDLRAVFTPLFYRGLLSFLTWWVCAAWTLAMTFGLYYHTRIET